MKRSVVIAVCFLVLAAAAAPAAALTLTFCKATVADCFCDGMTISQKATGLNGDKVWAGVRNGCASHVTVGAKNVTATGLTRTDMSFNTGGTSTYLYVIRGNRTWTNYTSTGIKINTGVWRLGLPAAADAESADSTQK